MCGFALMGGGRREVSGGKVRCGGRGEGDGEGEGKG